MAENDEDLVSQVRVEGTDKAATDVEQYADRAAAGFDKVADSAEKMSKRTGLSITQLTDDAAKARKAAVDLQNFKPTPEQAKLLANLEKSAASFSKSLKPLGQSIGQFAQRMSILVAASAAAGGALLKAASSVAKAATGTSDSLQKQTDAQIESNDAMLNAKIESINYASSQRQLFQQLQSGKITYEQYSQAVRDNAQQQREQQRVARDVAFATRQVKEENERLQATLKRREEYNKLIDTFGGPLTTALVSFGNQVIKLKKDMTDAFGPGIAAGIDSISAAFSKNGSAIGKFFDEGSKKLDAFVKNNGPAIQLALENIGAAAAAVFTGLIDAMPTLLTFFNEMLVPAVKGLVGMFTSLADTINAVFGTKITGGFLILITLIGTMTGAFKVMFGILKTGAIFFNTLRLAALGLGIGFGPFLLILVAVGAALYLLYTQVDWAAFGARVLSAVNGVIAGFNNFRTQVIAVKDAIVQRWTEMITFFSELPGVIGQFFTDMWEKVKQTGADAAQWVIDRWTALITWFQELPGRVSQFFVDLWEKVKTTTQDAIDSIKAKVKSWVDTLKSYLQPILDLINAIGAGSSGGGGGGGNTVTAAGGGYIRGPGTATSDSIPAWLSNNEYVVKAKAVGKYGVGFMNAINSGKFRVPKFNVGGLVSGGIRSLAGRTRFADGGLATGGGNMRPLSLSLFGESFEGLLMPDNVADRMSKFAIARQTRSAGRKPGWVGGQR